MLIRTIMHQLIISLTNLHTRLSHFGIIKHTAWHNCIPKPISAMANNHLLINSIAKRHFKTTNDRKYLLR